MRYINFILFLLITVSTSSAQAPYSFNYQGVARDLNNNIIANKTIGLQFELFSGGNPGNVVFRETHQVQTSSTGVFNLRIGEGNQSLGSLTTLDWSKQKYSLLVGMDVLGGSQYVQVGSSPLVSVPFALHATTVENNDDADADPANEMQFLVFDTTSKVLSISGMNSVDLSVLKGNGTLGSDDQLLQLNGSILSIEDGNMVDLKPLASPWTKEVNNGLSYLAGTVFTESQTVGTSLHVGHNQPSRVNITPSGILADNVNGNGTFSELFSNRLKFNASGSNVLSQLSLDSLHIAKPNSGYFTTISDFSHVLKSQTAEHHMFSNGSYMTENQKNILISPERLHLNDPSNLSTSLHNGILYFADGEEQNLNKSSLLSIDSLQLFSKGVGLLFDSKATLKDYQLEIEFGPNSSKNNAFGMESTDGYRKMEFGPQGLYQKEDVGLPQAIERLAINGNALQMHNQVNFQTVYLGQSDLPAKSGTLQLFDQGFPYVNFHQDELRSGYFELNYGDEHRIFCGGFKDYGIINTYGENSLNTYIGTPVHHSNVDYGGIGVLDDLSLPCAGMEVNELGYGEMFVDGEYQVRWSTGELVSYSSQFGYFIVNPLNGNPISFIGRDLFNDKTGIIETYGQNENVNVKIGPNWETGNENTGAVTVFDHSGNAQAGMLVNNAGWGVLYSDKILAGDVNAPQANSFPLYISQPGSFGIGINRAGQTESWEIYHSQNGDLNLYYNGSNLGKFDHTSGAYTQLSDMREKENVKSLNTVLPSIMNLEPVSYNYIHDESREKENIGLLAQQVYKIFPQAVSKSMNDKTGEDIYMLDYSALSVLAIKAIQEQENRIQTLEQKVDQLLKMIEKSK
ncbi:MAG: tail fiber domain-containing protein [Saprospiraceae bacterium]|nr:tail fiber domain-containing protein [Saprospiraceae bacterium]